MKKFVLAALAGLALLTASSEAFAGFGGSNGNAYPTCSPSGFNGRVVCG